MPVTHFVRYHLAHESLRVTAFLLETQYSSNLEVCETCHGATLRQWLGGFQV